MARILSQATHLRGRDEGQIRNQHRLHRSGVRRERNGDALLRAAGRLGARNHLLCPARCPGQPKGRRLCAGIGFWRVCRRASAKRLRRSIDIFSRDVPLRLNHGNIARYAKGSEAPAAAPLRRQPHKHDACLVLASEHAGRMDAHRSRDWNPADRNGTGTIIFWRYP